MFILHQCYKLLTKIVISRKRQDKIRIVILSKQILSYIEKLEHNHGLESKK